MDLHDPEFNPLTVSLALLRELVWQSLQRACGELENNWRLPILGTCWQGGPQQRIVVLRDVDVQAGVLTAYTDLRSPKIEQLRECPSASWLFYDVKSRVQLVGQGVAELHTDDAIADDRWMKSSLLSRLAYLVDPAPGTPIGFPPTTAPLVDGLNTLCEDDVVSGRKFFAVIQCRVTQLDLLLIRRTGNLRAHFHRGTQDWDETWLQA